MLPISYEWRITATLVPWRADKYMVVAAHIKFGWLGGALKFFRRQQQYGMFPAGGRSRIRRLRNLSYDLHSLSSCAG